METLNLPVWLIDIDGVVLPGGSKPGWGGPPRKIFVSLSDGRVLRERFASQLVVEMRQILTSGLVQGMWASTWCNDDPALQRLEKSLGIYLPRAFSECTVGGLLEKTRAARYVANSGRKLIWTDDDVIPQWGPIRDELESKGALLIRPDGRKGLQPDELETIRNYVGVEVSA